MKKKIIIKEENSHIDNKKALGYIKAIKGAINKTPPKDRFSVIPLENPIVASLTIRFQKEYLEGELNKIIKLYKKFNQNMIAGSISEKSKSIIDGINRMPSDDKLVEIIKSPENGYESYRGLLDISSNAGVVNTLIISTVSAYDEIAGVIMDISARYNVDASGGSKKINDIFSQISDKPAIEKLEQELKEKFKSIFDETFKEHPSWVGEETAKTLRKRRFLRKGVIPKNVNIDSDSVSKLTFDGIMESTLAEFALSARDILKIHKGDDSASLFNDLTNMRASIASMADQGWWGEVGLPALQSDIEINIGKPTVIVSPEATEPGDKKSKPDQTEEEDDGVPDTAPLRSDNINQVEFSTDVTIGEVTLVPDREKIDNSRINLFKIDGSDDIDISISNIIPITENKHSGRLYAALVIAPIDLENMRTGIERLVDVIDTSKSYKLTIKNNDLDTGYYLIRIYFYNISNVKKSAREFIENKIYDLVGLSVENVFSGDEPLIRPLKIHNVGIFDIDKAHHKGLVSNKLFDKQMNQAQSFIKSAFTTESYYNRALYDLKLLVKKYNLNIYNQKADFDKDNILRELTLESDRHTDSNKKITIVFPIYSKIPNINENIKNLNKIFSFNGDGNTILTFKPAIIVIDMETGDKKLAKGSITLKGGTKEAQKESVNIANSALRENTLAAGAVVGYTAPAGSVIKRTPQVKSDSKDEDEDGESKSKESSSGKN